MNNANRRKKFFSGLFSVPALLLFLPLAAFPLVWNKLFTGNVPLWGDAQAVSLKVMGVGALASLLFVPERLKKIWEIPRLRLLTVFAAAGMCVAFMQHLLYGGPLTYIATAGFFFLLPLAGVVYSSELKRLFPFLAFLLLLPVSVVTIRCPDLFGWMGNWNWNFTLIAIIFSSVFFFIPLLSLRKSLVWGVIFSAVLLVTFSVVHPDKVPRGTFAGIIGAAACMLVFRNIRPARRWAFALWAAALTVVLFIGSAGSVLENIRDSRFQLWRGSWNCLLAHFPLGVGFDRFESVINPFLPEIYYFTPFACPRHPHPHNELLNYGTSYGLVGVIFFVLLILLLLRGMRFRDRAGSFLTWSVLLLAVHGQFDVLLSMPLTGTWFLLGAGAVAGGGSAGALPSSSSWTKCLKAAALAGFVLTLLMTAVCWQSNSSLRRARLCLLEKDYINARKLLQESFRCTASPAALYTAGAVELFNFRNPDGAIRYLSQIESKLGLPHIYHSSALLARAYAVKGDYASSIACFDKELINYPFSALASGLKLSVLRQAKADSKSISEENFRFSALMKIRGLETKDFHKLLRNQELDDAPLKSKDQFKK